MKTHASGTLRGRVHSILSSSFGVLLVLGLLFAGSIQAQFDIRINPVLFTVESPSAPPLVTISPNPVSTQTYIYAAQDVNFIGLKIYDSSANLVFQGTYTTGVTWVATLNEGIHYFHVETDDGTEVVTVLIQEE